MPIIRSSALSVMERNPKHFTKGLLGSSSMAISDSDLVSAIHRFLPQGDFTDAAESPTQILFGSSIRECMSRINMSLEIPEEKDSLYRMFPQLIALLAAANDIDMIQHLSSELIIPVGPLNWNSSDFSMKRLFLIATCFEIKDIVDQSDQISVSFYESPIMSARCFQSKELVDLFSISCELTPLQKNLSLQPTEKVKKNLI